MSKTDDDGRTVPVRSLPSVQPYALSLEELATSIDVPMPTIEALIHAGKGPKVFKIGRRIRCRISDRNAWIDDIATGKIDATLVTKRVVGGKRVAVFKPRAPGAAPKPPRKRSERPQADQAHP